MKQSRISTAVLASATLLAAAMTMTEGAGAAARLRFECSANGAVDISMAARYDIIGTGATARRKFTTEFEAGPGTGFMAGNRLNVSVKGVRVGFMILDGLAGGGAVGDLNFDTRPQVDALPFPANWPAGVGRGTAVGVLRGNTPVLGCALR